METESTSPADGPSDMVTIMPTGWTSTAYADDTEWPWWSEGGDAITWVAIVYRWPEEPGETATIGCPRPGLAPEHWTWELMSPECEPDTYFLSGCEQQDPSPLLRDVVDRLHASAERLAAPPADTAWATAPAQLAKTRRILEDNTSASERSPITKRRTLALIDEIERVRAEAPLDLTGLRTAFAAWNCRVGQTEIDAYNAVAALLAAADGGRTTDA